MVSKLKSSHFILICVLTQITISLDLIWLTEWCFPALFGWFIMNAWKVWKCLICNQLGQFNFNNFHPYTDLWSFCPCLCILHQPSGRCSWSAEYVMHMCLGTHQVWNWARFRVDPDCLKKKKSSTYDYHLTFRLNYSKSKINWREKTWGNLSKVPNNLTRCIQRYLKVALIKL